jgi:hypothetical protein
MGIRSNLSTRVTVVNSIGPISTATLGVEGTALDTRTLTHGTRIIAFVNIGIMTEGTLTPSVVDCATSGGSYEDLPPSLGTFVATTTSNDESVQLVSVEPNPARPFLKIKLVETVSVTTAVPVSCGFLTVPASRV